MLRRGVNAEYERAEVGNKVYIGREQVYIISAIADAGTNIDVISWGRHVNFKRWGSSTIRPTGVRVECSERQELGRLSGVIFGAQG